MSSKPNKPIKPIKQQKEHLDHQHLGVENRLFYLDEWSPGCPMFLPDGYHIYLQLMQYLRKQYKIRGYQEIMTPDVWKNHLWMTSGHYDNYRENMFPVFTHWPCEKFDISGGKSEKVNGMDWVIPKESFVKENGQIGFHDLDESYSCKSMNCPGHCRMFSRFPRHHSDLPLRLAEFGTLHRNELTNSLRGLFRVRKFKQDDAHIFCTSTQIGQEVKGFLEFLTETYGLFGFDFRMELSTKPAKFIGDEDVWEDAEHCLESELNDFCKKHKKKWTVNKGDGAFYGPKIDIHLKDSLGREHQCGTIQLDFNLPDKFDLKYLDEDNVLRRPVILHRAVFGSFERFIGILVEHFASQKEQFQLPFWLSRKQVLICTLYKGADSLESSAKYALECKEKLLQKRWELFVDTDTTSDDIKLKIKRANTHGYHVIVVVGPKEVEEGTVAIRVGRKSNFGKSLDDVIIECDNNLVNTETNVKII